MNLWYDNTQEARLFRQHSRSVNNASCLSSIVVNERNHEAGISSVVMMGKLTQLVGSLEPANREQEIQFGKNPKTMKIVLQQ